tara:strand:+ start:173 stop:1399 length:1227 start_codon:yes stop_codon:yes gene_type:complete
MFDYEKPKLPHLKDLVLLNENNEFSVEPHLWYRILEQYSKKEIIEHFSHLIETTPVPFPYRKYLTEQTQLDFKSLCKEDVNWVRGEWVGLRIPKSLDLSFKRQGLYLDYISKKGLIVSDQFVQKIRMECGHKNSPSPARQWDRKGFTSKVRPILKVLMNLNRDRTLKSGLYSASMYDCLRLGRYMASQFKPIVAKAIYDFFGAKRILDFSAGWGDRLVGFLASNAESYIGIDPNTKLHEPYQQIVDFCSVDKETKFICSPAEDADLTDVKVDFIFTSPPYFNTEKYSDEETQSWKRYRSLNGWLNGFLYPTLKKCWDCLEDGGRIAINITDVLEGNKYLKVCEPMVEYMESLGATYEGAIGYRIKKRPGKNQGSVGGDVYCEPIFIWSKGKAKDPLWYSETYFSNIEG